MTDTDTANEPRIPEFVSGGDDTTGHLEELRHDPIGLMARVRAEHGDVGAFMLVDRPVALLSGSEANEPYFRAPESALDQAEAYPFMKPVFGEGVVFDASAERRREMMHNQALRDKYMRGHAEKIHAEIDRMCERFGEAGQFEMLDWFAELTIYTSTTCLIGPRFREDLTAEFAELFHDLEKGTDALAFVDPYMDIASFHRRDAAREELVALIDAILQKRLAEPAPEGDDRDLVDVLLSIKNEDGSLAFSADYITGMFISMMFAGHHTTSTTLSWTLIELLRNPEHLAAVRGELDELYADGRSASYQALREMPITEAAIKETLRLHPPLILLLRVAKEPFEVAGYTVPEGWLVGATPAISNRIEESFPDADRFDPGRYLDGRAEDLENPWNWIPFGAGRHRCVGAQFAMMQLKVILSVLLKDWDFELGAPPESYVNDHSKMVVQMKSPTTVKYRRRQD
ncbi:MAG: cytochrome P450 [Microthrixaceae bacterium]|nr:cytochrome P450 [Microthrixaceae bacterium]MCO5313155.1 cytochrome P450 [Microthrixaceae bacterium]HPB46383.1 cytochrome P450 [Microthrixaceae bacterium]